MPIIFPNAQNIVQISWFEYRSILRPRCTAKPLPSMISSLIASILFWNNELNGNVSAVTSITSKFVALKCLTACSISSFSSSVRFHVHSSASLDKTRPSQLLLEEVVAGLMDARAFVCIREERGQGVNLRSGATNAMGWMTPRDISDELPRRQLFLMKDDYWKKQATFRYLHISEI